MKMRTLGLTLPLVGCVTVHQGFETPVPQAPTLVMSCAERVDLCRAPFHMLSCTLENTGNDWLDVEVASIRMGDGQNSHVSTPDEIQAFVDAERFAGERDRFNSQAALASVALIGAVVAGSGGPAQSAAGGAVALGAVSLGAGREAEREWDKAQNSEVDYSKNHLLVKGIRVPPGRFTRKFVLVEAPIPALPLVAHVCLTKPTSDCLDIPLRAR